MKKPLLIILVILAVAIGAIGVCYVADDDEPLTIDVTNNILIEFGSGCDYYDKDGYILTGSYEDAYIFVREDLFKNYTVTFDNLTARSFWADGDQTTNVILKGENEITRDFIIEESDLVISAVDGGNLTVPYINFPDLYSFPIDAAVPTSVPTASPTAAADSYTVAEPIRTGSNDGTVTVNSGNINIDGIIKSYNDKDYTEPSVSCSDFIINGGTVTASNNTTHTIAGTVHLNGGTLNVINTASLTLPIDGDIKMKKGALLTISVLEKLNAYTCDFVKADRLTESDYFFVRYDTASDFIPVTDIGAALNGKNYAEIKIDTHEHSYTDGRCVCGYVYQN